MNGFNISWSYFGNIPIPKLKDPQLTKLVARMLELKQRLIALQDKPIDEEKDIKQEIISLDSEIDEIVYKLYGINQEERKIIEESTK